MRSNVIMLSKDRELEGVLIQQRTKDGYFCIQDAFKAINKVRSAKELPILNFEAYLRVKANQEFLEVLKESEGVEHPYTRARGRSQGTYCHPLLMIDIFMWSCPEFKLKVLKWLSDGLIKYRKASGDSFRKLNEKLYNFYVDKDDFVKEVKHISWKLRDKILGSSRTWNEATEQELEKRNEFLDNMQKLLGLTQNPDEAKKLAWGLSFGGMEQ